MVKLLAELTPAKINLFLRVTGRRGDGYHELDSVFLPISIADGLKLEVRTSEQASVALKAGASGLPAADRNLAVRAARAFMKEFAVAAQVSIELEKNIPIGAGLGGGSSDAAAVLRMMAQLCRIEPDDRLAALALSLGADVPYFLDPKPARIGGIGERITPLAGVPSFSIVIAAPPFEVSTAPVFAALKPENWSGAAPQADIEAICAGRITPALTVNDLSVPAIAMFPEIERLRSMLTELGARASAMTGSGGAVFGIFDNAGDAERAADTMRRRVPETRVFACRTLASAGDI
ncbi:MAG TPA: 4-(cytidine 5'-diphospho)-2-C-methyl-D-erythritol kinase [Candidatus Binataceae bacterium]|nr:4-(cytidine 5'-diphospho)-2-C-methyl-D-erythritol kinase [Candidatus Binataceae bacterium]